MILKDILCKIESKYPLEIQYNWDNSGLNLGDESQEINKVMLTLEITERTVDEAIENNIDLIISHHPFLFSKINKINKSDIKGNLIYKLISNSISVYCMHTSYDVAEDGLNDYFMNLMGIDSCEILEVEGQLDSYLNGDAYGLGRIGKLEKTVAVEEFIKLLKSRLGIENVRYVGDESKIIETVAVVTGSGAEFFEMAHKKGIDILITGDMKYHQAMDAMEMGMSVIDCGHYGSEHIFADSIKEFLKESLNNVEITTSKNIVNPFKEM